MQSAKTEPVTRQELDKLRQELLRRIVNNEERRKHQAEASKK
ncbi:MAG TPA: hypothetical protein VHZ24_10835 [Pirellulales bacterium]|jgi:hypothetical protein|nr:hypothetical protein [Pirellulales bacterium]